MKSRVKFYTLGCKTNQYETQAIREDLVSSGSYSETDQEKEADIFIINTCTVTAKADRDSRRAVRHFNRANPGARIVVTGCLTQIDRNMIEGLPGVSHIIKNSRKDKIRDILAGRSSEPADEETERYTPLKISDFHDRSKAFIKIQDGCDNFCSYCKIPLVRGRSRSRGADDILEEVERLLDRGFKELVLTGICLGDWGRDSGGAGLSGLIGKIEDINREFRVRLSSVEPNLVTDELIRAVACAKKVCRHLHIPLQSGSNKILKLMKRPYTQRDFIKLVRKIKRSIPGLSITSDVIVGFPGESKRDFTETLRLLRHIRPSRLHIFTYSERNQTYAARHQNELKPGELKRRRKILDDTAEASSYQYRRGLLNKIVSGLVETKREPSKNLLTGYTDTYVRFLLDGPDTLMGRLVFLKVRNVDLNSTFCERLY